MDANSGESVRPLTDRERATLNGFLSSDFAGVEELRAQVSTLQARPSCSCGCGSIALLADRRVAASPRITWSPLEADVVDDAGNSIGGLLLFANDGYLDDLEAYSYLDEPLQLPPVDRIRWSHVDS